jgi:hypothetical protein
MRLSFLLKNISYNKKDKGYFMGYCTTFDGKIEINPPLNDREIQYLQQFSETRHYQKKSGSYTIHLNDGFLNIDFKKSDSDLIDFNKLDIDSPSLYCCWEPSEDGQYLQWNGQEKFYASKEWLEYLIQHFLDKNAIAKKDQENFSFLQSHLLNGIIEAQGEEELDHYYLVVENNNVTIHKEKPEISFKKSKKYGI